MNPQGQASVQHNRIYQAFLAAQFETAMAFAATTDFITLVPVEGVPPCRYIARFTCTGLVEDGGQVMAWEDFVVGFYFPHDYIIRVNPNQVVSWLGPDAIFHSNVGRGFRKAGPLAICIGDIQPATPLVDLLFRVADVITWRMATVDERDALNPLACQWARRHPDAYPVDTRPLRRRAESASEQEPGRSFR